MLKRTTMLALLYMAGLSWATAQSKITGRVTNIETDEPLPFVTVAVKGTSIAVTTAGDGKYAIDPPDDAESLVFSFVGFDNIDELINGREIINVAMKSSPVALDEVIVVAYGTAAKRSFTGSAQTVKADQASSGSLESIDKALMGKVAGLRSNNVTGDPGSPAEVLIRGAGSINANTQPLYVIDGVVSLSNAELAVGVYKSFSALSSLNPEDIENVTVLKDAAASSLYGSRAANGVILITTKKGRQGRTQFTYSGEFGASSMASNSFEIMDGPNLVKYEKAAFFGAFLHSKLALYPDQVNYANRANYYSEAIASANNETSKVINDPAVNTDWRRVIYRNAFSQDHQLSASGGNDKTLFYAGLGYNRTGGTVRGSSFDRYSLRMNLDHNANKWLDFSVKQMLSYIDQKGFRDKSGQDVGVSNSSPLGVLLSMNPTSAEYDAGGNPNMNASLPSNTNSNPHYMLTDDNGQYSSSNNVETFRSMTTAIVGINFTPWLRFTETAGADLGFDFMLDRWAPESVDGLSIGGLGDRRTVRGAKLSSSSIMRFDKSFNLHNISAIAGFELEQFAILDIAASASNYSTWKLPELVAGQTRGASSSKSASSMVSALGNINYNYANRYFFSASIRTDASSKLSSEERWGTFWSASAAWNIAGEESIKQEWMDDLRIKVSYGTNGTLPMGLYSYMPQYSFSGGYGSFPGINWSEIGNKGLTWEKSNSLNVGIDMLLFSKLGLSVEYYNKQTTDLIMSIPASYLTGFGGYVGNNGNIENTGVEATLRAVNIGSKTLRWNSDFNIAIQNSKVKSLPRGEDVMSGHDNQYIYREGEAIWSFYLPEWAGVNPDDGIGYFYVDRSKNDEKTYKYGSAKRTIVGKALPDVIASFGSTVSFHGFDLYFLLTSTFGASGFDYPGYFMHSDGLRIASLMSSKDVENNYWTPDNRYVANPQPVVLPTYRSDQFSSRHIFSTDHVRVKELSLGYNFPSAWAKKIHLHNLKMYLKAVNPFMIWQKTPGLDPEVSINGYRTSDTPPIRVVSFGINIGF